MITSVSCYDRFYSLLGAKMKTVNLLKPELRNQMAIIDAAEFRLKSQAENDRKELRELDLELPYKIAQYYAGDISAEELKRVKMRIAELAERIEDATMADFMGLRRMYRGRAAERK